MASWNAQERQGYRKPTALPCVTAGITMLVTDRGGGGWRGALCLGEGRMMTHIFNEQAMPRRPLAKWSGDALDGGATEIDLTRIPQHMPGSQGGECEPVPLGRVEEGTRL